ncbi:MAG: hypothetical protein ACK4TL_20035 [Hyphomicrobiaceae bacterium]
MKHVRDTPLFGHILRRIPLVGCTTRLLDTDSFQELALCLANALAPATPLVGAFGFPALVPCQGLSDSVI